MTLLVPTNDPGATADQYRAQGWTTENIYCERFYRTLCDGMLWAVSFYKSDQIEMNYENLDNENNRLENLEVMTFSQHAKLHNALRREAMKNAGK